MRRQVLLEQRDGLVGATAIAQADRDVLEAVANPSQGGLEIHRSLEQRERFVVATVGVGCGAEKRPRLRVRVIDSCGRSVHRFRGNEVSLLELAAARAEQRVDVVRRKIEHSLEASRRVVESALRMQRRRMAEMRLGRVRFRGHCGLHAQRSSPRVTLVEVAPPELQVERRALRAMVARRRPGVHLDGFAKAVRLEEQRSLGEQQVGIIGRLDERSAHACQRLVVSSFARECGDVADRHDVRGKAGPRFSRGRRLAREPLAKRLHHAPSSSVAALEGTLSTSASSGMASSASALRPPKMSPSRRLKLLARYSGVAIRQHRYPCSRIRRDSSTTCASSATAASTFGRNRHSVSLPPDSIACAAPRVAALQPIQPLQLQLVQPLHLPQHRHVPDPVRRQVLPKYPLMHRTRLVQHQMTFPSHRRSQP